MTPPHITDVPQAPHRAKSQALDESVRSWLSQTSSGLSPLALARAYADLTLHWAAAPGHRMDLARSALELWQQAQVNTVQGHKAEHVTDPDARFADPAWSQWPYNVLKEKFKAGDVWWRKAVQVDGMTRHHQRMVDFFTRQTLDALSPSNWAFTNPEIMQKALETQGQSLVKGWQFWLADQQERLQVGSDTPEALPPLPFEVGKDVAATPGKVVWRNHLIELIQYDATTDQVQPEPVLIVPSCIMKYYILDLSPHNSMVRYLVSKGHTVFIVSWRNPDASDRDLKIQDYLSTGLLQAMQAVKLRTGAEKIHSIGYCLGGTFLAIAAAIVGRLKRAPAKDLSVKEKALVPTNLPELASVTLLAAQTDFTEPGELGVFIDEEQLATLRQSMLEQGYLSGRQMGESFQFMASKDMVWTRNVRRYLMGEDDPSFDLMSWNADRTRLPARMHSEYLTGLFLNNALVSGQFRFAGTPVTLMDIGAPIMAVGTSRDHVSPWRSVYKIHLFTNTPVTFVLASGGHNAGIVSEPGRPRRSYQIATTQEGETRVDPDDWTAHTPVVDGSWWEAMHAWLTQHSGQPVAARPIPSDIVLCDAPGTYVMTRYAD